MIFQHVAVIDIGKTNAKVALVDAKNFGELAVFTMPNEAKQGQYYPFFDVESIWTFLLDKLKSIQDSYLEVQNNTAVLEHEASTSKISADQIFYLLSRGIDMEEAIHLIVNGFCKEVLQQLPMEFAVEAQKLVAISLEGSVG